LLDLAEAFSLPLVSFLSLLPESPDFAEAELSLLLFAVEPVAAGGAVWVSDDGLLLFLKSVSYQPEPFSLKLLAETSFFNLAFPQDGQSVRGASLNF